MCLQYKSFEDSVGKGEIAHNEQFLLFLQFFLPLWRAFCHFQRIWNFCLQTLSVWKSLKFVVWERVKSYQHHRCICTCFPKVAFTSTLCNILYKPLVAFQNNHYQNMFFRERGTNSVTKTIVNSQKETGRAGGFNSLNHFSHVLREKQSDSSLSFN